MALGLKDVLDLCTRYGVVRIKAVTSDAGEVDLEKVILPPEEKEVIDPDAGKTGPDGLTDDMREELFGSRK